jgi:hypothetical protein
MWWMIACAPPAPWFAPPPDVELVGIPDGEPLRRWPRLVVTADGTRLEVEGAPPVVVGAAGEGIPTDLPGLDVYVDGEAPAAAVLLAVRHAAEATLAVQVVGEADGRPIGALASRDGYPVSCPATVRVRFSDAGAWLETDGGPVTTAAGCPADGAGQLAALIDACGPHWRAAGAPDGGDWPCFEGQAVFASDVHTGDIVRDLAALWAVGPRFDAKLPYADDDGACPAATLADWPEAQLADACGVEMIAPILESPGRTFERVARARPRSSP